MFKPSKLGCPHPRAVRRSRSGLLDALMYRFGRYPWVCSVCGCRLYHRDRRARGVGRDSVVWQQGRTPQSRTSAREGSRHGA